MTQHAMHKTLQQRIFHMQVEETQKQQNLLLCGLGCLILLTYLFYHNEAGVNYNQLTIWSFVCAFIIAISAVINAQLSSKQFKLKDAYIDIYLQLNAFSIGLMLAIGQLIFGLEGLHNTIDAPVVLPLYLFDAIIIFAHIFGLIALTSRIRCFYLLVMTSAAPMFTIQMTNWPTFLLNDPFYLIHDVYIAFILFISHQSYRTRDRLIWLVIRNDNLVDHAEQQRSMTEMAYRQIEQEMQERKAVEWQLQQTNQRLEEKVKERTFDIQQMNASLESSRQNLEMAHQTAGIGSWDWDIKNRTIHVTNFDQILGYQNEDMGNLIDHLRDLIHPEDLPSVQKAVTSHLRHHTDRYEATFRIKHKHGYWVWVHDLGRVIQRDAITQHPLRMVGIRRNINEEKLAAEKLKLSASVFERAAEGIFILDSKLHFVDINPRFELITGIHRSKLIGRHIFNTPSENQMIQKQHVDILTTLLASGEFEGEIIEHHADGTELPLWIHINCIMDEHERVTHYIGIISDLTQRKNDEQRLTYLANYDALTDLPNRNLFKDQLHQLAFDEQQQIEKFALIRINIDRFRFLNDSLHNDGGDILLQLVARRLRQTNTEAVMLARLGSDDFAIIYESTRFRGVDIKTHCKKIMQAFEQPFTVNEQELIVNISLGIAMYPEHGRQVDTLSNHAETALHEAKRLGGNTYRFYSKDVHLPSHTRVNLEHALRKAISNNQLVVFYQPKIDARTKRIEGFEALVRWQHPEHGLVSPVQFIPLAEETSLISRIGEIVMNKTCEQISIWRNQGFENIKVSVNVVAQQIQRGNLVSDIDNMLQLYGISPTSLELEITESSLLDDAQVVQQVLQQLKTRHISIALDDFGTGYSSLSYLGQYPIDVLKIDRSFVSKIGNFQHQEAIVKAILAMGHALNMTIVAEGVETQIQADFLTQEGCDLLQGYLLSKPLSAEDATHYLQQHYTATPAHIS